MRTLRRLFLQLLVSPTAMSWASHAARSLHFILVLPVALRFLDAESVAFWGLYMTVVGMQRLASMGFAPTVSRYISYAMVRKDRASDTDAFQSGDIDLTQILAASRVVFLALAGAWALLLAATCSWSALTIAGRTAAPGETRLAWLLCICGAAFRLLRDGQIARLMGANEVARLRRIESLIWLVISLVSVAAVWHFKSVLALVLVYEVLNIVALLVYWAVCRSVFGKALSQSRGQGISRSVLKELWHRSWRSAVGQFFAAGALQFGGIIYAGFVTAQESAALLISLNLVRYIATFSQAPFYSQIPVFNRVRAEGQIEKLRGLVRSAMFRSLLVYSILTTGACWVFPYVAELVNKPNVASRQLWVLLTLSFFAQRHAAMHLQTYSTTNHILWHIAGGVSGVILILGVFVFGPLLGVATIPVAHLVSQILFNTWFCTRLSLRSLNASVWRFELLASVPALCIVSLNALVALLLTI